MSSGIFASVPVLSGRCQKGIAADNISLPANRHGHETVQRPFPFREVRRHPTRQNAPIFLHSAHWSRRKRRKSAVKAPPAASQTRFRTDPPSASLPVARVRYIVSSSVRRPSYGYIPRRNKYRAACLCVHSARTNLPSKVSVRAKP